jgi:translation initiation factor eIF-2B subunit delta
LAPHPLPPDPMTAPDLESLIEKLAGDNTSGAAELARDAAQVFSVLAEGTESGDLPSFLLELSTTGRRVIQAQPSMAPLFNLVNTLLFSLDEAGSLDEARRRVVAEAQGFAEELASRGERIAEETLSLLTDGCTLLTHSRSSTVLTALLLAKDRGLEFEVVCTESRPLYEGRRVAEELSEGGIRTTLIADTAVAHCMSRVDLVMVGADSVSNEGLINKMGTHGVALAARAHGVPFYGLCGSEKLLPAGYPYFEIEARDPQEVWPGYPEGVKVLNYYFEVTPLEYLSGLVTERGLLLPEELEEKLGELKIHHVLLDEGAEQGRKPSL